MLVADKRNPDVGVRHLKSMAMSERRKWFHDGAVRRLFAMAIVAWVVPLAIIFVGWVCSPNPSKPKSEFPSTSFVPVAVKAIGKNGTQGSDHFELWLTSPDQSTYFLRDPEPDPVTELRDRVPEDKELNVVYWSTFEGNVLMEIAETGSPSRVLLSFDERMTQYASRRRLTHLVAGIIFVFGTAVFAMLWKARATIIENTS